MVILGLNYCFKNVCRSVERFFFLSFFFRISRATLFIQEPSQACFCLHLALILVLVSRSNKLSYNVMHFKLNLFPSGLRGFGLFLRDNGAGGCTASYPVFSPFAALSSHRLTSLTPEIVLCFWIFRNTLSEKNYWNIL